MKKDEKFHNHSKSKNNNAKSKNKKKNVGKHHEDIYSEKDLYLGNQSQKHNF